MLSNLKSYTVGTKSIFSVIVIVVIAGGIMLSSCAKEASLKEPAKGKGDGSVNSSMETVSQLVEGFTLKGSSPSAIGGDEIAFERLETTGPIPSVAESCVYLFKDRKEIRVARGDSPSLSKAGLYFLSNGELYFKESGKEALSLRLSGYYFVDSSRSGDQLILIKPDSDSGNYAYYWYQKKQRKLRLIKLPPSLYPGEYVSWLSENKIIFDAALGELKGERNVYQLDLNDDRKDEPKIVISGHEMPSVSPDERYLACINFSSGEFCIYDYKTLRKMVSTGQSSFQSYGYPAAWLSENRFAVTKYVGVEKDRSIIQLFEIRPKSN